MYDIFIEAGQSNAEGYGHGPVAKAYTPDPRILYLKSRKTLPATPKREDYDPADPFEICVAEERPVMGHPEDKVGDFSLSFAKRYIEEGLLEPGRKVLIVRAAVGGTGFLKHFWQVGDFLYERMLRLIDAALATGEGNRLMGFLWHQGEHEAAFLNDPDRYHNQLLDVVESVRQRYDAPQLPFICAGFCHQWAEKNQPASDAIMAVIRAVAAEAKGCYVQTADLRSNDQKTGDGDEIHFCREDLQELGRRYFTAWQRLCASTMNPDLRKENEKN